MENNNRPEIRFVKSKERWLKKRLGEIAEINPKTVLPNKFNYVDLESVIGTELKGYRVETKESAPSRAQRLAQTGDIFYQTVRPYQKNNYLFNLDNEDFVFSTGYAQLRTSLNSYFLFTKIQDDRFVAKVLDQCTGTSYPAINANSLSNIEVYIPFDQYEEKSIGAYFENLDKTIAIHQQELETLKQTKQGFLQKMFPKEGEVVPEFRFPGFNEEWELRKFGEIINERREKTKVENEDILLSSAIDGMYLNSELFSHFRGISNIGYLKIKKHDMILSAQNLHLGNCNINKRFDHGIISPAYKVYSLVGVDADFMHAWIKKDSTKQFFEKATTEGASACRKNIEWGTLYNQKIYIPNYNEQQKIGTFFEQLDSTIELHEKELEALKETKKAFLQKMFV